MTNGSIFVTVAFRFSHHFVLADESSFPLKLLRVKSGNLGAEWAYHSQKDRSASEVVLESL